MRIVLDGRVANDHFPGIGRMARGLIAALVHAAPEHAFRVLVNPSAGRGQAEAMPGHALECHASPFSLAQQWRVPPVLRRERADLYHSFYYLMPYRTGVPTVFHCHDLIPLTQPHLFTPLQRAIFTTTHFLALRSAAHTIAVSERTKQDILRHFGGSPERITVIHNGVDPAFVPAPQGDRRAVATRHALPGPYLLFVGSNKPHKNLVRLVQAFARFRRLQPASPVRLVVAGVWDPRYPEARAEGQAGDAAEAIRFLGPVAEDELPALYSGALALVFPSEYEGFGLPVAEAMACGVPVITSRDTSLEEVAGNAGVLVNPRDVEEIARAIERVVDDGELRRNMAERGRERARSFRWEHAAQQVLTVYDRVLRGRPAAQYSSGAS